MTLTDDRPEALAGPPSSVGDARLVIGGDWVDVGSAGVYDQ